MKLFHTPLYLFFALALVFISCKSDDNGLSAPTTEKKVKYEFSGNFSGRLFVVTTTNSGNLQEFRGISQPWTKELQYDKTVLGAGLSVQTENENQGLPGQTLILKVFLNNILKDTKSVTADANGSVNLAMSFYTF